ncbi:MAG: AmmeMemoRadiSam system protein A [Anaerolineales bacterium]|nr:AmmeMemoRadiSam system protein A [Anaerolineales bacterium]
MTSQLSRDEKDLLLITARNAICRELDQENRLAPLTEKFSGILQEKGACFITIKIKGVLRGCVGSIEAIQPLIEDVRSRAVAAAFQDPRFPPLTIPELDEISIEISRLTQPSKLTYQTPEDLIDQLRPGIDGVILSHQFRRATFLPQVWDQLPTPELFLGRLCIKMGLDQAIWRTASLQVETYQVEKFQEED